MKRITQRIFLISGIVLVSFVIPSPFSDPGKNDRHLATKSDKPFSLIVLPDTQFYAMSFPEIFMAQTAWIKEHREDRNIIFVTQESDIVQSPDAENEWQVADAAFRELDGVVPYGLAPGNHDIISGGSAPLYRKYFPMSRFKQSEAWGGSFLEYSDPQDNKHYDKNSYQLFNAGDNRFIAFNLEFCPPDPVIEWVGHILTRYPDRLAIITTHSFTDFRGHRTDAATCISYQGEGDNAGQEMWDKLIIHGGHVNIRLILSGHDISSEYGAARRSDIVNGRPIHQVLANYQHITNGGNGYLRIMTFNPAEHKIQVETYSPYINEYLTDSDNQFELNL